MCVCVCVCVCGGASAEARQSTQHLPLQGGRATSAELQKGSGGATLKMLKHNRKDSIILAEGAKRRQGGCREGYRLQRLLQAEGIC